MSERVVRQIYDELFSLESKIKNKDAYPIHKKLVFKDMEGINDIYGWLSKHIDFKKGDRVLDAGCGVGYGSCLLAKNHDILVEGISLSEKEVKKANENAERQGLEYRATFQNQSFDDLMTSQYHKIIAVESVKHSILLSKTLKGFKDALKPGGSLYIVEDFYAKDNLTTDAEGYKNDWNLVDVFRLNDYYKELNEKNTSYVDLTHYMPSKRSISIQLKLWILQLSGKFRNSDKIDVNRIFRGGYYLDKLYLAGLMQYGVLKYTKH